MKKGKKRIIITFTIILCLALAALSMMIYVKHQMSKIPKLSFQEALEYTTKDNPNALIAVGIIKDGQMSYRVYGENGKELSATLSIYEIGSITKTFTAALINKAMLEGKINIEDTIEKYLTLPGGKKYPSVKELLTHTSGYKGYYFENPMIYNFLNGRNDYYGITKRIALKRAGRLSQDRESYSYNYSNFGFAILGLVLEKVYDTDYSTLVTNFAQNELGLSNTGISSHPGDSGNYWDWMENDAYLPAGGITSTIFDMLLFAQLQLEESPYFSQCHKSLQRIMASSKAYADMEINLDEIGMSWIIDNKNGIIWHNGGTESYNSYLGFRPEKNTAVVVLSNFAPNYRIPATVLGVKLLLELDQD